MSEKKRNDIKKYLDSIDIPKTRPPQYWHYTENQRKTCMSYWFPKIKHLPVPKTVILQTALLDKDIFDLMDGKEVRSINGVSQILKAVVDSNFSYPVFLRTGMTSAKHDWDNTCFVKNEHELYEHMLNIILFSVMCDIYGLPSDVWVVREFLELESYFNAFEGMPISKEYRFFINGGKIEHEQPYWPIGAFDGHEPNKQGWIDDLKIMSIMSDDDFLSAKALAQKVADIFKDDILFSVDVCKLKNGQWYVTDMAAGVDSYKYNFSEDDFKQFEATQ